MYAYVHREREGERCRQGNSRRNTLKYNPHGRFVAVGGFGTVVIRIMLIINDSIMFMISSSSSSSSSSSRSSSSSTIMVIIAGMSWCVCYLVALLPTDLKNKESPTCLK